jgi:hypothetical protein
MLSIIDLFGDTAITLTRSSQVPHPHGESEDKTLWRALILPFAAPYKNMGVLEKQKISGSTDFVDCARLDHRIVENES